MPNILSASSPSAAGWCVQAVCWPSATTSGGRPQAPPPRVPSGRFTRGWHLNALLSSAELHELAAAAGFAHESTVDLSPYLEPLSLRDRLLDTGLGWLPLGRTPLGPVLGGAALQKCLARGWTAYEFVVFRRVGG